VEDPWLKTLRDALEHVNEAEFRDGEAVQGQRAPDAVAAGREWKKPLWKALLAMPEKARCSRRHGQVPTSAL
jgi:hypothetical protein